MKTIKFLLLIAGGTMFLSAAPASAGYAAGSKLSLAITCPTHAASDPTFSFILTNQGSVPVDVDDTYLPIDLMVHLTVKDASGNVVTPGTYISGSRHPAASRVLEPGQSVVLKDWVDHTQPQTSVIPIHLFGYQLSAGTYQVSAKATDSPDEPRSNVCTVVVN
ncbi:MAG: hypothetical protein JO219_03195 [Candidatus Eremiobacteraeota bacterium]|nr:hypothetical protein [Candidatus Eremiobacteraeota bacterium]